MAASLEKWRTVQAEKGIRVILDDHGQPDLGAAFDEFISKRDQQQIPLFITPHPGHRQANGFAIPSEFVLSIFELTDLPNRMLQLVKMYPAGLDDSLLRAMSVGAFRRALFLDDENHGRGEMDLADLRKRHFSEPFKQWLTAEGEPWLPQIRNRLEEPILAKFSSLFSEEREAILGCIKEAEEAKLAGAALADRLESAYPRRTGGGLSTCLPFAKGTALLIDDQAAAVCNALQVEAGASGRVESANGASAAFKFVPLTLSADDFTRSAGIAGATARDRFDTVVKGKLEQLAKSHDLGSFDLVLLDLSLGEGARSDPLGYQMLPILKKFFPLIPLIAYTKYRDMAHIERAFRRGATWYLPKDETGKLAEHFQGLVDQVNWEREWRAVQHLAEWDHTSTLDLPPASQHLVWKTVEHMPGGRIRVQPLTGGIGGAQTVHASREINGRYDRATPIIIKIGHRFNMLLERERYQRFIQPYLSNLAGRIDVPMQTGGGQLGAIAYTYAGSSQGWRGGSRKVVPLSELLQQNIPFSHRELLPAEAYEGLMDALLKSVLRRIHSIDPSRESAEIDFPNSNYWESPSRAGLPAGSALDSYTMRMLPEYAVEIDAPLSEYHADFLPVYVLDVKPGSGIQGVTPLVDGLLHRIDLVGLLGTFYADHRHLRPMQPLWIPPASLRASRRGFSDQWEALWRPAGAGRDRALSLASARPSRQRGNSGESSLLFGLAEAEAIFGNQPGEVVTALYRWLTERNGVARGALEQGRIGIVHGDLNLGNIMVEREVAGPPVSVDSSPWLIDFARTRRDRIVLDYTQLELDLCMRLVRYDFFPSLKATAASEQQDWSGPDNFTNYLLESFWLDPACVAEEPRLRFIYQLLRQVREGARSAGVNDREYLSSRIWQCLIIHKIYCKKWQRNGRDTFDPQVQFQCVWSLKQAVIAARLLGWGS